MGPGIGAKEENYMKRKIVYSDYDMGEVKVVKDFLPSPDQLVFKKEQVKVTMEMSKKSIDFFKSQAKKHGGSYQVMLRRLVDCYVDQQQAV